MTKTNIRTPIFSCVRFAFILAFIGIGGAASATIQLKVGPGETYKTIQSAVDAVPAALDEPYVIAVSPGMYPETVTITKKNTSPINNLTISGSVRMPAVIDATGKPFGIDIVQQDNVVVDSLVVRGATSWANVFLDRSSHNTIRRCVLRDNASYDGITLSGSTANTIEHNTFYANHRGGVYLVNSSSDNRIRFNVFAANDGGIEADFGNGPFTISENWNCFFQNSQGDTLGFDKAAGDLSVDPRFIDTQSLRLAPGSPVGAWGPEGGATQDKPGPVQAASGVAGERRISLFSAPNAGGPAALIMDCLGLADGNATATLRISHEDGRQAFAGPAQTILGAGGVSTKARWNWTAPREMWTEIYTVQGEIARNNERMFSNKLYLRVPGATAANHPMPLLDAARTPARAYDSRVLLYGCEIQPLKQSNRGQAPQRIDPVVFDQLKANGGATAHLIFWWSYIEPAPGVYDFSAVDWALEQCKRVGVSASLSVWMADNVVPNYVADETMMDQFGNPFMAGRSKTSAHEIMPSLWGSRTRELYGKLIDTICRRYVDDPTVVAWAFMYQHNEVVLHDRTGNPPILYDYSRFSQDAYRRYLSAERGWSLAQLNKRYGKSYRAWDEVCQPAPKPGLDGSLEWSDFQDYRLYSVRNSFEFVFKSVRAVDPNGKKLLWAFNPEGAEDVFDKYHAVPDYSSSEAPRELDRYIASRLSYRRPLITEPTTIPPGPYEIGAGYFDALAAPAQGYWWVGTVERLFPATTAAAGLFRADRDAWSELADASPMPSRIAILRSDDTALATDKVFFNYPRFFSASNYESLILRLLYGHYDYQPIYSTFFDLAGESLPQPYKLIVDTNSIVMRESLMKALVDQVTRGATLILQPQSGAICREYPDDRAQALLPRLGFSIRPGAKIDPVTSVPATIALGGDQGALPGATVRFLGRSSIGSLVGGEVVRGRLGDIAAVSKRLGKGKVVVMAGDIDWADASAPEVLGALAGSVGVAPTVRTNEGFRARVMRKGSAYFVLLFNESGSDYVESRVGVDLPSGPYELTNVTDAMAKLPLTSARSWHAGFPVTLAPLEFRVYRLRPI